MKQPRKQKQKSRYRIQIDFASNAEMERVKAAAGLARVSQFLRKLVLDALQPKQEAA